MNLVASDWIRVKLNFASWIHSYFDNVMTKFMINNRTDAWKTDVNLLNRTRKIILNFPTRPRLGILTVEPTGNPSIPGTPGSPSRPTGPWKQELTNSSLGTSTTQISIVIRNSSAVHIVRIINQENKIDRAGTSISVRWSIYIINSVDKPNFRVMDDSMSKFEPLGANSSIRHGLEPLLGWWNVNYEEAVIWHYLPT